MRWVTVQLVGAGAVPGSLCISRQLGGADDRLSELATAEPCTISALP